MNLRSVVVLYGRAGRLTAKRGGPRPGQSLPLLAAEVCEKLGRHADALLYAAGLITQGALGVPRDPFAPP